MCVCVCVCVNNGPYVCMVVLTPQKTSHLIEICLNNTVKTCVFLRMRVVFDLCTCIQDGSQGFLVNKVTAGRIYNWIDDFVGSAYALNVILLLSLAKILFILLYNCNEDSPQKTPVPRKQQQKPKTKQNKTKQKTARHSEIFFRAIHVNCFFFKAIYCSICNFIAKGTIFVLTEHEILVIKILNKTKLTIK